MYVYTHRYSDKKFTWSVCTVSYRNNVCIYIYAYIDILIHDLCTWPLYMTSLHDLYNCLTTVYIRCMIFLDMKSLLMHCVHSVYDLSWHEVPVDALCTFGVWSLDMKSLLMHCVHSVYDLSWHEVPVDALCTFGVWSLLTWSPCWCTVYIRCMISLDMKSQLMQCVHSMYDLSWHEIPVDAFQILPGKGWRYHLLQMWDWRSQPSCHLGTMYVYA